MSNSKGQQTPLRVLVADNSPARRDSFCALLESAGYETLQANNVTECLKIVAEKALDLVVLDVAFLQQQIADRQRIEREFDAIGKKHFALLGRLVKAQEDEQRRISRELHDQMGQSLTALLLGLKSITELVDNAEVKSRIHRLESITNRIAEEVHNLVRELRPTALDDFGLDSAISNYTEEWSQQTNIRVDFHANGLLHQRLDSQFETTIYRIVQEALNNVLKHAKAKNVSVLLKKTGNWVSVIVEDDGVGFDAEKLFKTPAGQGRFGLLGMRERVMLVGGSLDIESTPGIGTTIMVHIDTSRPTLHSE